MEIYGHVDVPKSLGFAEERYLFKLSKDFDQEYYWSRIDSTSYIRTGIDLTNLYLLYCIYTLCIHGYEDNSSIPCSRFFIKNKFLQSRYFTQLIKGIILLSMPIYFVVLLCLVCAVDIFYYCKSRIKNDSSR